MKPAELAKVRSDLINVLRSGAERIGEEMTDPADDWQFVCLGARADGTSLVVGIDPAMFATEELKDRLADGLGTMVQVQEFVAFAMIVSAWAVELSPAEQKAYAATGKYTSPSGHPKRIEVLQLMGLDRFGDESYKATINRTPDGPPTLSPWERFAGGAQTSGRFVDPFRIALRLQG